MQFLPTTFRLWSVEIAGYVLPFTEVNEYYVAVHMIEKWVRAGYSDREISLTWNQGHPGACKSGRNKHNAYYDSCAYAQRVLTLLR